MKALFLTIYTGSKPNTPEKDNEQNTLRKHYEVFIKLWSTENEY